MTDAEKTSISNTLFQQLEDMKERKQKQMQEEAMDDRALLDVNRELQERARQVETVRRKKAQKEAEYLKQQMEEKRQRDKELKDLYANKVAGEFFSQFGSSHR